MLLALHPRFVLVLSRLMYVAVFLVAVFAFQYEDEEESLGQVMRSPRGIATVVCNVVALVAMLPFTYMEVRAHIYIEMHDCHCLVAASGMFTVAAM
jgi:hypothetical protein